MTETASSGAIVAYCDGGSRGNPGPAGYGVSIEDVTGRPVAELSEFLGVKTNNFAEYSGLLAALEYAISNGYRKLRVVADSELMVKQMKGQYRVNSPDLRPLWEEAKRRAARLETFEIQHVLRGKNKRADALANQAMDRGSGRTVRELRRESGRESGGNGAKDNGAVNDSGAAPVPRIAAAADRPAKGADRPRTLKGFVKNGVVHLLEGELPENCFVRVTVE
jgi:ribonuclease HI